MDVVEDIRKNGLFNYLNLIFSLHLRVGIQHTKKELTTHGSCEKNFLDSMRGGGGGVFGLFLTQIYKKCNGGGGGEGSKSEKNS
jgi:hypothetical protein